MQKEAGPVRQKGAGHEEPARQCRKRPGKRRPAREEMIRIDDERETMGAFVVNSFF